MFTQIVDNACVIISKSIERIEETSLLTQYSSVPCYVSAKRTLQCLKIIKTIHDNEIIFGSTFSYTRVLPCHGCSNFSIIDLYQLVYLLKFPHFQLKDAGLLC